MAIFGDVGAFVGRDVSGHVVIGRNNGEQFAAAYAAQVAHEPAETVELANLLLVELLLVVDHLEIRALKQATRVARLLDGPSRHHRLPRRERVVEKGELRHHEWKPIFLLPFARQQLTEIATEDPADAAAHDRRAAVEIGEEVDVARKQEDLFKELTRDRIAEHSRCAGAEEERRAPRVAAEGFRERCVRDEQGAPRALGLLSEHRRDPLLVGVHADIDAAVAAHVSGQGRPARRHAGEEPLAGRVLDEERPAAVTFA